jgi:single-stranded-DNA-specific exonuclease
MYAAGMTLKEENYSLFKEKKTSTGNNPSGPATSSEIDIDAEINFADITPN